MTGSAELIELAPVPGVRIVSTTRTAAGFSPKPYDRCNLGDHVGDDPALVARNRTTLQDRAGLPGAPRWLSQVHGRDVVHADTSGLQPQRADAAWTRTPGVVCAVLTADCLPLILAADDGSAVAAVHAGWRGLAAGVIEAGIAALPIPAARLHAWLGPAIGPLAYEVGAEVRQAFVAQDPGAAGAFVATRPGHWHCDLYALARRRLTAAGVRAITGGDLCTHTDAARFFSHRRDGVTGRQATLVWISPAR